MEIPVDQIELQFFLRQGVTYVKVLLVRNGIKTCVAQVPVLSRQIVLPLREVTVN